MPDWRPSRWLWPRSLLGRLSLIMLAGVLVTQLTASFVLAHRLQGKSMADAAIASQYVAHSAANTIRFFRSVPANYRPLMIQQLREMGGTRFFINLGGAEVAMGPFAGHPLAEAAVAGVRSTLAEDLPMLNDVRVAFAWPDELRISNDGTRIVDLPEAWVRHILLIRPDPAPILVIQAEIEPGDWLYLATLMPNPYFLADNGPLRFDHLVMAGLPLVAALLISIFVALRWVTRPLAALAEAADAFGRDGHLPELKEEGSREFVSTVRAFTAMRQRIGKYLEDRERLFVSISHDLRTPITRLKLRAELLEDESLKSEFEEDLDELDMMVKGALQCVKDSDIYEDATAVLLDRLLDRLVRGARLGGREVDLAASGLEVWTKPLALKRALGNLLDNALFYGNRAWIRSWREGDQVHIEVRDDGPGVPEEALNRVLEPRVRLAHGHDRNQSGLGLGLGIARDIVASLGGALILANHPDGGLIATVSLPFANRPDAGNAT